MAKKNTNLHAARANKDNEFYTRFGDIEAEISKDYYGEFFRDKIIYCNCDDSEKSNFFKFFFSRHEYLGWKKLICTSYNPNGKGTIRIIDGDKNHNGILDEDEYKDVQLEGNGDFRSQECIKYLDECDVVVTNPPFGGDNLKDENGDTINLFSQFILQIINHGKKFLVIGPHAAVTYKHIFPLLKDGKMWTGRMVTNKEDSNSSIKGNSMTFNRPDGSQKTSGSWWFTNIEEVRKNDFFIPKNRKSYNENDYPKYDNYDAIEVNEWHNIPLDYDGVMGVAYTGLKFFNHNQFETVDARTCAYNDKQKNKSTYLIKDADGSINGKPTYARICIRRKLSCE